LREEPSPSPAVLAEIGEPKCSGLTPIYQSKAQQKRLWASIAVTKKGGPMLQRETIMSDTAEITDLKSQLRGTVIERSDAAYEEARALYNGMIDKRPLAIARCVDVADVITAVNFGRDRKLPIAIRGGGHNGPGLSSVNVGHSCKSRRRCVGCRKSWRLSVGSWTG
jgi:hypothetical protein